MVTDSLQDAAKKEEEEEIELNLELSLGPNKLMGSSSIDSCLPLVQDSSELLLSLPGPHSTLSRTSSLPLESEKEWRRRKQQQSLRRLEAKRRRSEKQRILKEDKKASGISVQTINPPEGTEQASISGLQRVRPDQSKTRGGFDFSTKKSMEDMPSVFTMGDDPNGRRVDGILYKYGRGEEVRIMCICHGNFYSPAEFIRHAGGTNVDCPLKHIVMKPSSSFL